MGPNTLRRAPRAPYAWDGVAEVRPFGAMENSRVSVVNSTITGEGGCLMIAGCALGQKCNGRERVLLRNDLFQGQPVLLTAEESTC
ncbi:hypothetical protein HGA89_07800, partial [bacterium]|nr:hypothetical protein [bacterium]